MPRRKLSYSKTDVMTVWNWLERSGKEPVAFKGCEDGGFRILCKGYVTAKKTANDDDPTLAGWDDVKSNGKA